MRGNTVVGATAALGAVVTGGLLMIDPGTPRTIAGAGTDVTPLGLAAEAHVLAVQPSKAEAVIPERVSDFEYDSASTTLLPVAGEHASATADKRDVDMLHKAERLAAEASEAHAAAAALAAREALVLKGGGNLNEWISVALTKMNMSQSYAPGVRQIIMKESRGNPKAINRWDSNALAGRPSQGLMQTIPSTFRIYVLPELAHLGITNPVANITAGVRYMVANYGPSTLKSGGRTSSAGSYIGY